MPKQNKSINDSLRKLDEIVGWFEEQEEVDVEKGLARVKEGTALIKELKERLKQAENEFVEVRKELGNVREDK